MILANNTVHIVMVYAGFDCLVTFRQALDKILSGSNRKLKYFEITRSEVSLHFDDESSIYVQCVQMFKDRSFKRFHWKPITILPDPTDKFRWNKCEGLLIEPCN